jgi:type IV pilus assembly protein PilP
MSMRSNTMRLLLLLTALLAVGGCTRGSSDLRQWVAQQKARKGAPLPPLPVIKTFESFIYKDQALRDPFAPSPAEDTNKNVKSGPRPDQNRPRQPLEAFALDSLKMVGTIGVGKNMEALIKDPGGVIHQVHKNNYMGQNYGRVTDIAEDRVKLVELVPNGSGGWMERKASIALDEQ